MLDVFNSYVKITIKYLPSCLCGMVGMLVGRVVGVVLFACGGVEIVVWGLPIPGILGGLDG